MGWTDESVEELRRLWDKGLTANEIAKKLGVTKNAIVGKVHRLCLKARPSPIKTKGEETAAPKSTVKKNVVTEIIEETNDTIAEQISETVVETPVVKDDGSRIRLVELDSHTCRWPLGDPRDEDFGFCGKKVRAGQTYCDEHSTVAYVKANRK